MPPFSFLQTLYQAPLNIVQMEWIQIDLPQKEVFQSGIGKRKSKKSIIVKLVDQEGNVGYGECACRPDPFYSAEFLDAVQLLLEQFIFPSLPNCKDYSAFQQMLKSVRGWPFAKAAVDFAVLQLLSPTINAFDLIPWERTNSIPPGISMSLATKAEKIQAAVNKKYKRLKFKINPDFDIDTFGKLELHKHKTPLLFDANGTLSLNDTQLLERSANLGITIEQPFPPGRLDWCITAKQQYPSLKICLDEEIKNIGILKAAFQLNALDEVNLKAGRVGGLIPSLEILDFCREVNLPCWIGGMFETGIGRIINMQFASLLPNAAAHDISPASRYFEEDIIEEAIEMNSDGFLDFMPFQYQINESILEKYTRSRKVFYKP